jgi:hypothetical protein
LQNPAMAAPLPLGNAAWLMCTDGCCFTSQPPGTTAPDCPTYPCPSMSAPAYVLPRRAPHPVLSMSRAVSIPISPHQTGAPFTFVHLPAVRRYKIKVFSLYAAPFQEVQHHSLHPPPSSALTAALLYGSCRRLLHHSHPTCAQYMHCTASCLRDAVGTSHTQSWDTGIHAQLPTAHKNVQGTACEAALRFHCSAALLG